MKDTLDTCIPTVYNRILEESDKIGFNMSSDKGIGSLLKTLIASKPAGNFLELGTGLGLSLSWMVDGMDADSEIISIDNDPKFIEFASGMFIGHKNVEIVCADANDWITNYENEKFDLIFADAWPGKYELLDETLALVKSGGFYIIDDMNPQVNWPEGHQDKADRLMVALEQRSDLVLTKMNWSTGLILATKK